MPIATALNKFQTDVAQCDSLISGAHRVDAAGVSLFTPLDREQITIAAFLNFYVAWESYLEASFVAFMVGTPTTSGAVPGRYAMPPDVSAAQRMLIGINKYFDYGNHDFLRKIAKIYFPNGYPFEPHISSISSDLADLKTMRNASAHLSSTTNASLEALAQRIFSRPCPGINLYVLLTSLDPRAGNGITVYLSYKAKVLTAAELIAIG